MEIYEKTVQVLGPEVSKAKHLMRFVQTACTRFTDEVKTLAHPEKRKAFISETYLLTLAKLVNMFATLDSLKNMKACINNDLACYKRYGTNCTGFHLGGGGERRQLRAPPPPWIFCTPPWVN